MSDTYSIYLNQNLELKCRLRWYVNVGSAQWALHWAEVFLPTTIKSHMVKIFIIWSISPYENNNIGLACDFQQCGIMTSVDSEVPVQPPFKLRNSKWCSVSSLTLIEYSSD